MSLDLSVFVLLLYACSHILTFSVCVGCRCWGRQAAAAATGGCRAAQKGGRAGMCASLMRSSPVCHYFIIFLLHTAPNVLLPLWNHSPSHSHHYTLLYYFILYVIIYLFTYCRRRRKTKRKSARTKNWRSKRKKKRRRRRGRRKRCVDHNTCHVIFTRLAHLLRHIYLSFPFFKKSWYLYFSFFSSHIYFFLSLFFSLITFIYNYLSGRLRRRKTTRSARRKKKKSGSGRRKRRYALGLWMITSHTHFVTYVLTCCLHFSQAAQKKKDDDERKKKEEVCGTFARSLLSLIDLLIYLYINYSRVWLYSLGAEEEGGRREEEERERRRRAKEEGRGL